MKTSKVPLIVIVAPSGSGKSTIIKKLKVDFPEINESVSFTTRKKRKGEIDSKDYFFIDEDLFKEKIQNKDFLEWELVHSNYYGTSIEYVENCLKENKTLLFDLDVKGTKSLKNLFGKQAKTIFIEPPSIETLKKRLIKRGTESEESINERINNAKEELKEKDQFDFSVINDDLEKTYVELKTIITKILGNKCD